MTFRRILTYLSLFFLLVQQMASASMVMPIGAGEHKMHASVSHVDGERSQVERSQLERSQVEESQKGDHHKGEEHQAMAASESCHGDSAKTVAHQSPHASNTADEGEGCCDICNCTLSCGTHFAMTASSLKLSLVYALLNSFQNVIPPSSPSEFHFRPPILA